MCIRPRSALPKIHIGARCSSITLSRPSVAEFGLKIQGEAVVKGEHTMYLIVDAGDERQLQKFLAPFERAGIVEVHPASTCSGVVAAGGCGATMPISELDRKVPRY
jgi:hypothetical protein